MRRVVLLGALALLAGCAVAPAALNVAAETQVGTFAGSGATGRGAGGFVDGPASAARFNKPVGLAFDAAGNAYVADQLNHRIRRITPAGEVSTLAGSGTPGLRDGGGDQAQFNYPSSVAIDARGDLYVGDFYNHAIRRVSPGGQVTTVAGDGVAGFRNGRGAEARFDQPYGLAFGPNGLLHVADAGNHLIRTVTREGRVETYAGSRQGDADGTLETATFNNPDDLAFDSRGNLYVVDFGNAAIRKITPNGLVSTLAGGQPGYADGAGAQARFDRPQGIAIDGRDRIFVADTFNHRVRQVSLDGVVTTLAGAGQGFAEGPLAQARFDTFSDVTVGPQGALYVADNWNHRIRWFKLP